jgi:hypothetical protein
VVRLSDEEKDLGTRSETLRATLEQDGAVAFAFALQSCRDDLSSVAEMLGRRADGRARADAAGRRVAQAAGPDRRARRRGRAAPQREEGGGAAGSQAQQGPPPLVPQVAELLLIQRMEQAALARLENFIRLNPGRPGRRAGPRRAAAPRALGARARQGHRAVRVDAPKPGEAAPAEGADAGKEEGQ